MNTSNYTSHTNLIGLFKQYDYSNSYNHNGYVGY